MRCDEIETSTIKGREEKRREERRGEERHEFQPTLSSLTPTFYLTH